jgi:tetratricopeptide (TPR) repeat protein
VASDTRWRRVSSRIQKLIESGDLDGAWRTAERAALRAGRGGSSAEDLVVLLRLAVLAAQYGEVAAARRWIDERASRAPASLGHALDAIRLAVDLAIKDYVSAAARGARIPWRSLPPAAWCVNVRLLLATSARDHATIEALLRRPSPELSSPPDYSAPYDRATRLRILGIHCFGEGRWKRGADFFRAALRQYAREPGVDARLKEVEILGASGTAAYHEGRVDEAEGLFRAAIDGADRLRHSFYRNKFEHELALVWADREEYARSEELFLRVAEESRRRCAGPFKDGRAGSDHFLRVAALLAAAGVALDRRDGAAALVRIEEAARLLGERDHTRYRGHLHLSLGRHAALGRDADAVRRALEHFDLAERCFLEVGDGDLVGLARVRLYRGRYFLRLRDVREALAETIRCDEASRASGFQPLRTACLLLKSRLLLVAGVPRQEGLYEEVLGNLGAVHTPVAFFKVVANLYLYSWELEKHLELTDAHLRQINHMAGILDRETFGRLYETHVCKGVERRQQALRLGVHPWLLDDDPE